MNRVVSKDTTPIAFDRSGDGPPLIIVDGALCSRRFGPSAKIAAKLSPHFTVYTYDRRGRGESGNMPPYAPAREIDDIAALIEHAGGSASLVGLSSGAALALHAAANGLPVTGVVAYEPPYDERGDRNGGAHRGELERLIGEQNRAAALKYFMRDMVRVPRPIFIMLRCMPWIWRQLTAVAHTLPYDAAVMTSFTIPRGPFSSIRVPTLVMNGTKTDPMLREAARAIADTIPSANYRELAGQTHNVKPDVLAAAVVEFLSAPTLRASAIA